MERRQVAAFEKIAKRSTTGNRGWIDLLWPGHLAVEHKSAGENLDQAMGQLVDYLGSLSSAQHPWLLVACDFRSFKWSNLESGEEGEFALASLPDHLDLFSWMAGYQRPGEQYENDEDANLKATALLAEIHDRLKDNGYGDHDLREWLTRILFCLFADDTGVWDRAAFHAYIALHTRPDGSDLGQVIAFIFQMLDTPVPDRPRTLDEDLAQLTYINGDLFASRLPIATCDERTREALLNACRFDWGAISPAIFGSMFQNVMDAKERRQLGAHYTTEANIMRTIRPLFVDQLEAELKAADSKPKLHAYINRLASLKFLDPACGCGNFLVITYREIRRLETEAVRQLRAREKRTGQRSLDVALDLKVRVNQFYGIEIEEFPAKIARTALYLIDHLCNRQVSTEFGQHFARFPIPAAPHIEIANGLTNDWAAVLPSAEADYVFGNPPFGGHTTRTLSQSNEMRAVWGKGYAKWLDYVTSWYRVAMEYDAERRVKFAFVSTNSISQGEQVARLWQPLLDKGYRIDFGHQTFAWTSEARGRAHVHVVVVGFSHNGGGRPRLFTYASPKSQPVEIPVKNLSPYLLDGPNIVVAGRPSPLSPSMPKVRYGSLPSDGGGLVVEPSEFPHGDSVAEKYLREYYGSDELVNGLKRWVVWMPNGPDPGDLKASPFLRARLEAVRDWRMTSKNPDTVNLAATPYRFFHNAQPSIPYIGIPAQVSAARSWYTVSHLQPSVIASNTLYTAADPDGFLFTILSSSMFVTWCRVIGGQLKSDLRYSKSVVHNTFPVPTPDEISDRRRSAVIASGQSLLAARAAVGGTLATQYDPLATPPGIIKAHGEVDKAVDALFSVTKRKWSRHDRYLHLIERYAAMLGQLGAPSHAGPRHVDASKART